MKPSDKQTKEMTSCSGPNWVYVDAEAPVGSLAFDFFGVSGSETFVVPNYCGGSL